MERFRRFLGAPLREDRLHDAEALAARSARPRWVPEELEDFDEVEFALPLDGERELTVSVAVEKGRIGRMILGWAPAGDDDADARALDGEEISAILGERGDAVVSFLDFLTADAAGA